jgi:MFS family permease
MKVSWRQQPLSKILTTSIVGCFLGSVFTSFFGEGLGRKKSIFIGVIIMIIGALLQSTAYSRAHMVVARVVSGIGMGFINSTVPVFQSEFSPKAGRGLYVCMQLSTLNFGILLAYWIDYAFSSHLSSYAWRIPVILQCIFLLPMIPILLVVPETPRWLASHDRGDESLRVLQRLHRTRMSDEAIRLLHADIMNTVALEKSIGAGQWKDLIKNDSIQSQRRFFIACAIQAFQQLGGINAIIVRTPSTHTPHSLSCPILCRLPSLLQSANMCNSTTQALYSRRV